jgi:hypothetical protein
MTHILSCRCDCFSLCYHVASSLMKGHVLFVICLCLCHVYAYIQMTDYKCTNTVFTVFFVSNVYTVSVSPEADYAISGGAVMTA